MVQTHISRYEIRQELGRGGMGRVFRAYDPSLGREVALKLIIPQDSFKEGEWQQRFRREVWAAGRLNHPHIVTIHDVNLEHDPPYVVMELLTGGSLREWLQAQKLLSWSETLTLLRPLAQALAYAHRAGVIHRDVKPGNIMFTQSPSFGTAELNGTPKLVDFGLARLTDLPPEQHLTQTGLVIGTPAYMSPEQARGEVVDGRTDIFALGLVALEAMAGYNPLQKNSTISTLAEIVSDRPVDTSPLSDKAPPEVVRFIEQAVTKSRHRRYPTCDALLADLERCLKAESGVTRSSLPYPTPPGDLPRQPIIRKPERIPLSAEIEAVLRAMFRDCASIAVEAEFGYGLSGGRVFRVRPDKGDGQPQLSVVVKVAPLDLIQQEWAAYQNRVKGTLAEIARLEDIPTSLSGVPWGGLRYALAGGGVFEVQSLYAYYQEAPVDKLLEAWHYLLEVMYTCWWQYGQPQPVFQRRADYDALLPVNLLLKPANPLGEPVHLFTPDSLPSGRLTAEDYVQIRGFIVTEVDDKQGQLTLNLPPTPTELPTGSYRLRLEAVPHIDYYRVGHIVDSISGQVVATRDDLLAQQVSLALGEAVAFNTERLLLPAGQSLPNPLPIYQDILDEFGQARLSLIHGDLNLENILIDRNGKVTLIDFATTRQGHVLHDLLRLETEIVTKLIPPILVKAKLPPHTIRAVYEQLHQAALSSDPFKPKLPQPDLHKPFQMLLAIRRMAHRCLFNPDNWIEYYQGLTLYLLGALKFRNLDELPEAPLPKQVAFWSAATSCHLRDISPVRPVARPKLSKWPPVPLVIVLVFLLFVGMGGGLFLAQRLSPEDSRATTTPLAVLSATQAVIVPTLLPTVAPHLPTESIAVVGQVQGKVKVQRYEDTLVAASTGLALFQGDILTSPADSWAYIHCLRAGLFKLTPGRAVALTCQLPPPEGLELIAFSLPAEVYALVESAAEAPPSSLSALANVRGSRSLAELGSVPILLSPRQLTSAARPAFRWTEVKGAEAYTLRVEGKTERWSVQLEADQLIPSKTMPFIISPTAILETVYPADAPALEPNTTYLVTVQAHLSGLQTPLAATEPSYFELVDAKTATALSTGEAQIRALSAPEGEKIYLLSLLYQQHNLWIAAANQLETLARLNPTSPPLIPLGDLYLRAGLPGLAEANSRRALEIARADADLYTQAAALTGLGQTAYAVQANAEAREYFTQSLALYRQLGDERQARAITDFLTEVE